jgi:photosystem II protein
MKIEIQFIEGVKEEILPIIKLTKSKNGKTGTATFVFINPTTLAKKNCQISTNTWYVFDME